MTPRTRWRRDALAISCCKHYCIYVNMSATNILNEMTLNRSRQIIALRQELNAARGYHATKIGDAIAVNELAMVMYAEVVETSLLKQERLTSATTVLS